MSQVKVGDRVRYDLGYGAYKEMTVEEVDSRGTMVCVNDDGSRTCFSADALAFLEVIASDASDEDTSDLADCYPVAGDYPDPEVCVAPEIWKCPRCRYGSNAGERCYACGARRAP